VNFKENIKFMYRKQKNAIVFPKGYIRGSGPIQGDYSAWDFKGEIETVIKLFMLGQELLY
jgi:hypothetical protein